MNWPSSEGFLFDALDTRLALDHFIYRYVYRFSKKGMSKLGHANPQYWNCFELAKPVAVINLL